MSPRIALENRSEIEGPLRPPPLTFSVYCLRQRLPQLAAKIFDGPPQPIRQRYLGFPLQILPGPADIRPALPRVILRQWLKDDLASRASRLNNRFSEIEHRHF